MANFFDQFDDGPELATSRDMSPYAGPISSIESGSKGYKAVGPATRTGDRALGKYQVMSANIRPWSQEVLGREVTPTEFMADPKIQDAIFNGKFGQYAEKYGPEGAAKAWFAGEKGMNDPNRKDVLGTTVDAYGRKFTQALGYAPEQARGTQVAAAPQPAPAAPQGQQVGNFFDQFDVPPAQQDGFNVARENGVTRITPAPFTERFEQQAPAPTPELTAGMDRAAEQMRQQARGPATAAPGQQIALDYMNQGSAAGQGTTPNIDAQMQNFISADVHENDAGEVLFRDASGQLVPTDQNKHVALRDPQDGRIKIFRRSEATDEGVLSSAGRLLGTGMAAGAPTARPAIPTPTASQVTPKASDIFSTSKPYYRAFSKEAGQVSVPTETAIGFAERIRGALGKANLIEELAQPVFSATKILEKGNELSLDDLQNVKRVIGRSFNSPDKNVRDAAAVASAEIGKIIREVSPSAAKNLKMADDIHSTARSVQDLQRKTDVAGLRAGRAGYGGNAVNSMRQVLSPIVQRAVEGRNTAFKPNEIQAMREIVEGTTTTNALRLAGQVSPNSGLGTLRAVGAAGTAIAAGASSGMALAIPAIGLASNKLATVLTGKQIERLQTLVAKRSPAYAEAVAKATQRYERAQMEFVNKPAANNFAKYLTASRALSAGLSRDGLSVTSGDLLRAIQGGVPARAENE